MMGDVMQNAGLSIFPQIGLFFFVTGFLLILANVILFVRSERAEKLARLPLDDEMF